MNAGKTLFAHLMDFPPWAHLTDLSRAATVIAVFAG